MKIYLDIETRSTIDLRRVGLYRYATHPTTEALLARFRLGDAKLQLEWRPDRPMPEWLHQMAADPEVTWVAHNAAFERILWRDCLQPRQGWPVGPPLQRWDCTMARARACALPGGLEEALKASGAAVTKNMAGHRLMLQMCKPRALHPDGSPIWWEDAIRMEDLARYCGQDVDGCHALDHLLPKLSPSERAVWIATEEMNDRGVRFDLDFCRDALRVADAARKLLNREMAELTGRAVPAATNVAALKGWLVARGVDLTPPPDPFADPDEEVEEEEDEKAPGLRSKDIERLLLDPDLPRAARRALEIRHEAAKISVKKLDSVLQRADAEGYVRGLTAYHGASTGRDSAAGGGVQIQNFPRDTLDDWDTARRLLRLPDAAAAISALYGPPLQTLSKMLRGAIIPDAGHEIISIDYAAVELHGVAWLAGQQDLVEDLRKGAKIYEQMASHIYGVPAESIGKDSLERFVAKSAVLGSGYQMGHRKFWHMCRGYGVTIEIPLAQRAITTYRTVYGQIPQLWYAMNDAMIEAVRNPGRIVSAAGGRIKFLLEKQWLRMALPSGRSLRYANPRIERDEKFDREGVTYWGVNPKTKQWGKQRTFGGRVVENAVQGLCRDLLMEGAARLKATGRYSLCTRVHDETVMCVRPGEGSVEEASALLCVVPDWARGFPLRSSGWSGSRYS